MSHLKNCKIWKEPLILHLVGKIISNTLAGSVIKMDLVKGFRQPVIVLVNDITPDQFDRIKAILAEKNP